jgi:glucose-6-phosphate isomerase
MPLPIDIASRLDLDAGTIAGGTAVVRHLSDLRGVFADANAFEAALRAGDPVVYTVSSLDTPAGPGELHCGLGVLYPGRVGDEFYLTKGHLHRWRAAAEYYVGLRGSGLMLLEHEDGSGARALPLAAHTVVHVPGGTAHRTVNTSDVPLVYLGIFPADAGHDYAPIAQRNFSYVVTARPGGPEVLPRSSSSPHRQP